MLFLCSWRPLTEGWDCVPGIMILNVCRVFDGMGPPSSHWQRHVVLRFLLPMHEGTNDRQRSLLLKGTGSTWQEHALHQETIAGAELRVSKGLSSYDDESYF